MSVRPTGLVALAVTTALIGAGCGFSLSGPDPQRPRNELPKCDTNKGAVVLDGVMATVASVVAIALVANDETAGALVPAGIAAAYIGGAVHGSRAVDECRAAQDQWSTEMAARDTLSHTPPPGDDVEEQAPHPKKKPVFGESVAPPMPQGPPDVVQTGVPEQPYAEVSPPVQPPTPVVQPPPVQAAPVQPPQQPAKKKTPPPSPPPSDDAWSEFWREVQ